MTNFQKLASALTVAACVACTFTGCRGGNDSFTPFGGASRPVSAGSGTATAPPSGSGTTSAPAYNSGSGTSAPAYSNGSGGR